MNFRRLVFWIHLTLGLLAGLVGGLMAATGVVMAFADTYLDLREHSARSVDPAAAIQPASLAELVASVNATHPDAPVNRIGLDRDPRHAVEMYGAPQNLDYVDPYSGAIRASDSVPLRRTLHKGVEQWHRFLGLRGERNKTGKLIASWVNVMLIPLFITGLVLWCPAGFRRSVLRSALSPATPTSRLGTHRSWHAAFGFWTSFFLLIMVLTATTHSFEAVRKAAMSFFGAKPEPSRARDSLWAPNLGKRPVSADAKLLNPDELRVIADREIPNWTRLDIFLAGAPDRDHRTGTATLSAKAPGWGPSFFPVAVQVDPYTGEVLDIHSWEDLSGGTRFLAWSRWLHKGEAFGRTGQMVAGLSCLVMLVLIYTGWALAIRRLLRRERSSGRNAVA